MTALIEEKPVTTGVLVIPRQVNVPWNKADAASVAKAEAAFNQAKQAGFSAQAYATVDSYRGEVVREFSPEAGYIRMSMPYAGG